MNAPRDDFRCASQPDNANESRPDISDLPMCSLSSPSPRSPVKSLPSIQSAPFVDPVVGIATDAPFESTMDNTSQPGIALAPYMRNLLSADLLPRLERSNSTASSTSSIPSVSPVLHPSSNLATSSESTDGQTAAHQTVMPHTPHRHDSSTNLTPLQAIEVPITRSALAQLDTNANSAFMVPAPASQIAHAALIPTDTRDALSIRDLPEHDGAHEAGTIWMEGLSPLEIALCKMASQHHLSAYNLAKRQVAQRSVQASNTTVQHSMRSSQIQQRLPAAPAPVSSAIKIETVQRELASSAPTPPPLDASRTLYEEEPATQSLGNPSLPGKAAASIATNIVPPVSVAAWSLTSKLSEAVTSVLWPSVQPSRPHASGSAVPSASSQSSTDAYSATMSARDVHQRGRNQPVKAVHPSSVKTSLTHPMNISPLIPPETQDLLSKHIFICQDRPLSPPASRPTSFEKLAEAMRTQAGRPVMQPYIVETSLPLSIDLWDITGPEPALAIAKLRSVPMTPSHSNDQISRPTSDVRSSPTVVSDPMKMKTSKIGNFLLSSCPGKKVRLTAEPAGTKPSGRSAICRDLFQDLQRVKQAGARALICCLDDVELEFLGNTWPEYASAAGQLNLEVIRLPMAEGFAPASVQELDTSLAYILQKYSLQGFSVLAHCRGGVGRAGLVACCWMLKLGIVSTQGFLPGESEQDATIRILSRVIDVIRRRRSMKAIETPQQVGFVMEYISYLRTSAVRKTANQLKAK